MGTTALMLAACNSQTGIVKLLLQNSASVQTTDNAGRGALYYGGQRKSLDLCKLMVRCGATDFAGIAGVLRIIRQFALCRWLTVEAPTSSAQRSAGRPGPDIGASWSA
jgi:hypothetical protein